MVGCTIVATNYLPYARVVEDGWRQVHPDDPFHVLVIDADGDAAGADGLDVITPDGLGLSAPSLARLRGIYGVAELSCALKPHLLRHLLDRGADAVVYVDSDTDVHASLDEVAVLATSHGVALSPHVLAPPPLDGLNPGELEIGRSGIFNSGLIAVGHAGRPFLDWWASRLRRDCLFCEEAGLHADQRWLDWVPLYFEHAIMRDPALHVAHWNLQERRIGWTAGAFTVNDGPLRTFHFAGFDPERPDEVTGYEWSALRGLPEADPALGRLCREYAGKLLAAGYREARGVSYAYATSAAGTPLGDRERAVYREIVLAAEARELDVPDPFDATRSAEFERLIAEPRSAGLLSDTALARLGEDGRGRWHPRRTVAAWLGRRWTPRPTAGDRTRMEYAGKRAAAGA